MEKIKSNRTKLIATKVTKEEFSILEELASRINRKPYSLLYLFVKCLLKYGENSQPVGEELRRVIDTFDTLTEQKGRKGLFSPTQAVAALYFLEHPTKGTEAVLVQGERTYRNGDAILRKVLRTLFPTIARTLERIESSSSVKNWAEIIEEQLSRYDTDEDDRDYIRTLFSDNYRSDFGQNLELRKYKPLNKKSPYVEEKKGSE